MKNNMNYVVPIKQVDPMLDNVFMTNGYTEVQTEFGSGIVVEELAKQNIAIGKAFVLSQHVLNGAEAKWIRTQLKLCETGAAKMIGCTAAEVVVYENRSIPVPIWYDKLLKLLWVMEWAEDDVDICTWSCKTVQETNLHYGKINVGMTYHATSANWVAVVNKLS